MYIIIQFLAQFISILLIGTFYKAPKIFIKIKCRNRQPMRTISRRQLLRIRVEKQSAAAHHPSCSTLGTVNDSEHQTPLQNAMCYNICNICRQQEACRSIHFSHFSPSLPLISKYIVSAPFTNVLQICMCDL